MVTNCAFRLLKNEICDRVRYIVLELGKAKGYRPDLFGVGFAISCRTV